jgi:hypothetical protein
MEGLDELRREHQAREGAVATAAFDAGGGQG